MTCANWTAPTGQYSIWNNSLLQTDSPYGAFPSPLSPPFAGIGGYEGKAVGNFDVVIVDEKNYNFEKTFRFS